MWSPRPTVFSLLTNQIRSLSTALASEYPAIHYALLYALLQDCRRYMYILSQSHMYCMTTFTNFIYFLFSATVTTFLAVKVLLQSQWVGPPSAPPPPPLLLPPSQMCSHCWPNRCRPTCCRLTFGMSLLTSYIASSAAVIYRHNLCGKGSLVLDIQLLQIGGLFSEHFVCGILMTSFFSLSFSLSLSVVWFSVGWRISLRHWGQPIETLYQWTRYDHTWTTSPHSS